MAFCPFMSDYSNQKSCSGSCALYKDGKCSIRIIAETSESTANSQLMTSETLRIMQLTRKL